MNRILKFLFVRKVHTVGVLRTRPKSCTPDRRTTQMNFGFSSDRPFFFPYKAIQKLSARADRDLRSWELASPHTEHSNGSITTSLAS